VGVDVEERNVRPMYARNLLTIPEALEFTKEKSYLRLVNVTASKKSLAARATQ
jgi:hypothetical protein